YVCLFKPEEISLNSYKKVNDERNKFMKYLLDKGISTRPGTHAVHIQKYFSGKYGIMPEDYPNSLFADKCTVSLPIFPSMTSEETDYVINTINNY
ncbi:MAG: DegT/DnrJ/EryC1/StrS family aminotransferase, partial [Ignavibacteria bacterium]|nr:DegT/DnrJ/EryC1/StrS family aminotransferase [Ignavibacteria bacterium]